MCRFLEACSGIINCEGGLWMHRKLVAVLTIAGSISAAAFAADKKIKVDDILDASADALSDVMRASDKGIPRDLLDKARCVVVVPDLKKAGFIFGAKNGRGFAVCRRRDESGWSAPAALLLERGKFHVGAFETDIVLLVMSGGMKHVLSDRFTIGGTAGGVSSPRLGRNVVCGGVVTSKQRCATAVAGPLGRDASTPADVVPNVDMLSWSRSRGLFAGISLDGVTIRADDEINRELYAREITNREILTGNLKTPAVADKFIRALNRNSEQENR
jgi:lipid-binding SYLF domain-containing protein